MNFRLTSFIFLTLLLTTFTGCQVMQDIFAAGAWTGIIGILVLIGIIYLIVKAVKK
ncbi:MAG: hypothetical protein WD059_01605 [Balneolaceae bacterium]